jgi:hypothetical protein
LQKDAQLLTPKIQGYDSEGNALKASDNPMIKNLIDAIVLLCQQDKNVRDFFLSLTTGSAYTNVMVATIPLIIAILANHNLIPALFTSVAPVPNVGN